MGNSVGIDLGTTNSIAAFNFDKLRIVTADDNSPEDRHLTRSVVAWENNQIVVGHKAYTQIKSAPENVITSIKRLMGRDFGDAVVQQQLSRTAYKITQSTSGTENSVCVSLGGQQYSPEDISAFILKQVLKNAQIYLKHNLGETQEITQAVITVPAYFNDKQRYATQQAAYKAGLKQVELLAEPTAAAISYGYYPNPTTIDTILVYDLGSETFDSSIITTTGKQFIKIAHAGNLWRGGNEINQLIANYVITKVAQEEEIDDIDGLINKMPQYQKFKLLGELKFAAEKTKIELSTNYSAKIILSTPLLDELGMAIPIFVTLTREQFEDIISPFVDETMALCQKAIEYSGYTRKMIHQVLLVGGSCQIPLVVRKARELFGADKVKIHPRPTYAVAEGAAIATQSLVEKVGGVSSHYFIEAIDNDESLKSNQVQAAKEYLLGFKFIAENCDFLLTNSQHEEIQIFIKDLQSALMIGNLLNLSTLLEQVEKEENNFTEPLKLILDIHKQIAQMTLLKPGRANIVKHQLMQMIEILHIVHQLSPQLENQIVTPKLSLKQLNNLKTKYNSNQLLTKLINNLTII